jgi:hypothetical protein
MDEPAEDFNPKCTSCGKKKEFDRKYFSLCKGCQQSRADQAYLDNGAFAYINEQCGRHQNAPGSYDDSWEKELGREGVYE